LAVLVCIIAIGSPGVPGGINMSCSSLVMSIVLAGNAPEMGGQFFAIMTAIYTIQDGFGTACNITCDGALTLITETYLKRINDK
jgi:Na+/H+-dicarboxylate symporter